MKAKRIGVLLIVLGVVAALGAAGLWLYNDHEEKIAAEYSETMTQTLLSIIQPAAPTTGVGSTHPAGSTPDTPSPTGENAGAASEVTGETADEASVEVQTLLDGSIKYITVDQTTYVGILNIPSLNLSLPVNCVWSMASLRYTPCRFSGSIEKNTIVIGAHRLEGHFGRIDTLQEGTAISLLDVEGNEHNYIVSKIETVPPSATLSVVHSGYALTLFTCTYGGQARVVVRCVRQNDSE